MELSTSAPDTDLIAHWRNEPAPLLPLLHAFHERTQKRTTIASTFHGREDRSLWQGSQLLPTQFDLALHAATHRQPPLVDVNFRILVMTANEEPAVGSYPTLYFGQRSFAVFGWILGTL